MVKIYFGCFQDLSDVKNVTTKLVWGQFEVPHKNNMTIIKHFSIVDVEILCNNPIVAIITIVPHDGPFVHSPPEFQTKLLCIYSQDDSDNLDTSNQKTKKDKAKIRSCSYIE